MENNPFQDLIVESTPIIGVLNKVINADLSIVNRVEYYSLNLEELICLSKSKTRTFRDTLFTIIQAKAFRLSSLNDDFEEHDELGEPIEDNAEWNNLCESVFDAFPERNLIKEIGVIEEGDNRSSHSDESRTF